MGDKGRELDRGEMLRLKMNGKLGYSSKERYQGAETKQRRERDTEVLRWSSKEREIPRC